MVTLDAARASLAVATATSLSGPEGYRRLAVPVSDVRSTQGAGLSDGRGVPEAESEVAALLESLKAKTEQKDAGAVMAWARECYGESLVASSSFGAHAAVMLHLLHRHAPDVPVVCIDTGYLFEETYRYMEQLRELLGFRLHVVQPSMSAAHQEAVYGRLWEQGEQGVKRYLWLNKVEPMQRALTELGAKAWVAGLRQGQTAHRGRLRVVERQDGRIKIHPILSWTADEVEAYLRQHDLPPHPLVAQGYRSIGDWHSTLPTAPDQDPREGRILGKSRECGLHLPLDEGQARSLKSSGL